MDQKHDSKSVRCPLIQGVLAGSPWLFASCSLDSQVSELDCLDVVAKIKQHIECECSCLEPAPAMLISANAHFEIFLKRYCAVRKRIEAEEMRLVIEEETTSNKPKTNDVNDFSHIQLDGESMSHLINLEGLPSIVDPLKVTLDDWERAFETNAAAKKTKKIAEVTIMRLHVYYNLSVAFHAFGVFSMPFHQLRAALVMEKLCDVIDRQKYIELYQLMCHRVITSYLEVGAVPQASQFYHKHRVADHFPDGVMPKSFGSSFLYLSMCEIMFVNQKQAKLAGRLLKKFIESDYLKTENISTNRYYIRIVALLLASRFSPSDYQFSTNLREFIEPVQSAYSLLIRWNPLISKSKHKTCDDPVWFKLAITELAMKVLLVNMQFYLNAGLIVEISTYYNPLVKVARQWFAFCWLSKIFAKAAQIDYVCQRKSSSILKLVSSSNLLNQNLQSQSNFWLNSISGSSSPSNIKSPISDNVFNSPDQVVIPSQCQIDYENDNCGHQESNLFELIKNFSANKRNEHSSSENLIKFGSEVLAKNSNSNLSSISEEIPEKVLVDIEIFVKFSLYAKDLNSKQIEMLDEKLKYQLNYIDEHIQQTLKSKIISLFQKEMSQVFKINRFKDVYDLKLELIMNILKLETKLCRFDEALLFGSKQNLTLPAVNYNQQMTLHEINYLQVLCYFMKIKQKGLKFNVLELNNDEPLSLVKKSNALMETPPKNVNKNKIKATPGAPKAKNEFKNEEMLEYMNKLKESLCGELERKKSAVKTEEHVHKNLLNVNELNFDLMMRKESTDEQIFSEKEIPSTVSNKSKNAILTRQTRLKAKTFDFDFDENNLIENEKSSNKTYGLIFDSKTKSRNKIYSVPAKIKLKKFEGNVKVNKKPKIKEKLVVENFETKEMNLEDLIDQLKDINEKMGPHPSVVLYQTVHKLLMQLHMTDKINNLQAAGFHFAECANANTLRYRNFIIDEKKKKLKLSYKYRECLDVVAFNSQLTDLDNHLLDNWRLLQIFSVENGTAIPDLLVCRYQKNKTPIFIKVKGDSGKFVKHFMVQFKEIVEKSNMSIHEKDKVSFWKLRSQIDEELRVLLKSVQDSWFGCFRGILIGKIENKKYNKFCIELTKQILIIAKNQSLKCLNEELLESVVESLPILTFEEFCVACRNLFGQSASESFIQSCYKYFEAEFVKMYPLDNYSMFFKLNKFSPIGLVIDNCYNSFPFESFPIFTEFPQSIFRIPSLRYLNLMLKASFNRIASLNVDDVYYLLNPADNLNFTQGFFNDSLLANKKWIGTIGKAPEPCELKKALETKDIYLFFGHGAGAVYYRSIPAGLDGVDISSACVVMGCSSGCLTSLSPAVESYGAAYRFLLNGAPCFVGALWDVTDKDIDRFSDKMLSLWMPTWKRIVKDYAHQSGDVLNNQKEENISTAVCRSRNACKLKHIVGAATVVYGLPMGMFSG